MTLPGFLYRLRQVTLDEVAHVQGFMQLLMKQRNGVAWSEDDKAAIRNHLKHFARSLPYLVLFTLPGGTMLFPGLAWFLDRRKNRPRVAVQLQEGDPSGSMPPRSPGAPPG
jgi:hypothetical protein